LRLSGAIGEGYGVAETHFRTCPLCEATCGLAITVEDGRVTTVRGDDDDVFSKGFICPKGTTLKQLHEDPDRLRAPVVREGEAWREVSWDEAFATVESGLVPILERHGRDAVALYAGNPTVHSLGATLYVLPLLRALGTKNYYSAATVDQMPKHVSTGLMFGNPAAFALPDVDRTQYLVILGANPWVSNGSLATAPDFPGRLKAISARGGKVVVVDPRLTRTAKEADEHIPIRPGTDALFLLAVAQVLFAEGLVRIGRLAPHVEGIDVVRRLVEPYTPESVARRTGIAAETIRRIAREIAAAPAACVYDRIGTHTVEFGTITSWIADAIVVLTGNLDEPGGKMFGLPAHGRAGSETPGGRGFRTGKWRSRVKGYPEVLNQFPAATLADEIETPGEGQIRAFVVVAGNPVISNPNGRRLERALASLEFMVSVDPHLNETSRFATVILPPPSPLESSHYDFAFYLNSVRSVANYSPPIFDPAGPPEWEILARLALIAAGQGAEADPMAMHEIVLGQLIQESVATPGSAAHGRDPAEIRSMLEGDPPLEQIIDLRLRAGRYGDGFGANPNGILLATLEANPHGIDFGPLEPRFPGAIKTESGKIELAPAPIVEDMERLRRRFERPANGELVLIGRRQLRSNNSWGHNIATMMRGSNTCTLQMNPEDATRLGLENCGRARVTSRVGTVEVEVEVTEDIMPGVVSLPHGWGHDAPGVKLSVAAATPGVNSNILTDEEVLDTLSGNAVLNAIPVSIEPAG
jgi:anaerobic selenocysteine-containing dehydrogenase